MPVAAAVAVVAASAYSANRQASAAKKAAAQQSASAAAANDEAMAAREQSRADLEPFRKFGEGNLTALQNIISPDGQVNYLENNPMFKAALGNLNQQTTNNAAVRGRLGAGDTKQNFINNWQAAALPLLANQQNALFNAANIGQSSAAGQANTSLTTGQIIGQNLMQGANARAAGIVGAANANAQGIRDAAQGISSIYGYSGNQ